MVYFSMIYLLCSIICRSDYDVSTRRLRALITYWCHVCCLRKSELAHVHNALRANRYPEWALAPPPSSAIKPPNTNNNPRRSMLGLPYVARLSEQLGRIYKSHNIHMYHKPANTLRSMIVHPKDKTPKEYQCGTIYNITCDIDSSHTYIGETKRTLRQRFKEHTNLDKPTGVGDHCHRTLSVHEEH